MLLRNAVFLSENAENGVAVGDWDNGKLYE
jgi:hypothetical protein